MEQFIYFDGNFMEKYPSSDGNIGTVFYLYSNKYIGQENVHYFIDIPHI